MNVKSSSTVYTANVRQMVALLHTKDPDLPCTIRFPMVVGALARRDFRTWLDSVEAVGIDVQRWEQKGWLSSNFTVKLHGSSGKLANVLVTIANWKNYSEADDK